MAFRSVNEEVFFMSMRTWVKNHKTADITGGIAFGLLTIAFLFVFLNNNSFFDWAFERHHNLLSWYIRPLFTLPIVFFAYKKSWSGVMASVFCLFTSMFWFPVPIESTADVEKFLAFEMDYLKGAWTMEKILFSLTVPAFFAGLIAATWKRNWKIMIGIIVLAAVMKVLWSALFAGPDGLSIIKPAISGLVICVVGIYFFIKQKRK